MQRTYRFDPLPQNTHALLLAEVPEKSRVLEIGTASGYMGEYLIHQKSCEVWGAEPVQELFQDARQYGYTKLFNVTAEDLLKLPEMEGEMFDVIFIGDVLEHMVDPWQALKELKKFLKPNGRFVISLPNVAHYTIRKQLLLGRWNLQESGIMDRTHLRFFTRETMRQMLDRAGLQIVSERPSAGYIERRWRGLGKYLLFWRPELFAVQFIFVATTKV